MRREAAAAAPRHATTGTRDDYTAMAEELAYTKSVLTKYKMFAERKLEDQSLRFQQIYETSQLEMQSCAGERDQALRAMQRLTTEVEAAAERLKVIQSTHREEVAEMVRRHSESLAAAERRRTEELAAVQRTMSDGEAAEQRAASLEEVVRKRDDEIRRLRKALSEATSRQTKAEDVKSTSLTLLAELQQMKDEAIAFAAATAPSAMLERGHHHDQETDPLVRCLLTSEDLRDVLGAAHAAAAVRLRDVLDHSHALEEQLQKQTTEIQRERELTRRRLEEVERDRATERAELQRRIETSRVDSIVASQVEQRHRSLYEQAAAGKSHGSPQRRRTAAVAVQTQMDAATLGGSSSSSDSTLQRLAAEINRLQEDNYRLRDAVLLLEDQRATFLGFANGDAIGSHIANVLAGPSADLFQSF